MVRIELTRIFSANIQTIPSIQIQTHTTFHIKMHLHCSLIFTFQSRQPTKRGKSENSLFAFRETPKFWGSDLLQVSVELYWARRPAGLSGIISCSLLWQISVSSWHHSMLRLTSNDGSGLCTYHHHQTLPGNPFLTSRVEKLHCAAFNYPMYWLIACCGISLLFASLTVVKLLDFASLSGQNGFFFRPSPYPTFVIFLCKYTLRLEN